jgi:hypothetical protein
MIQSQSALYYCGKNSTQPYPLRNKFFSIFSSIGAKKNATKGSQPVPNIGEETDAIPSAVFLKAGF